jgi:hypothetical protein
MGPPHLAGDLGRHHGLGKHMNAFDEVRRSRLAPEACPTNDVMFVLEGGHPSLLMWFVGR